MTATTAPRTIDLAARLRRASSERGMAALLRGLGITGEVSRTGRAELRARGLIRLGARAVSRLQGRGPQVWLVGLARPLGPADLRELARSLSVPDHAPSLLLCAAPRDRVLLLACLTAGGELRLAAVDRLAPTCADRQLLEELRIQPGASALATSLHWARTLDRSTIGVRFFRELRAQRDAIARAWQGLPARLRSEREQLALLLLCRLLFLYFLQQRGHLLGGRDYLAALLRRTRTAPGEGSLYERVIRPLFFGALNTRPERRTPGARVLGDLPYLNGGLFEVHALERRFPELRLPDATLLAVFADLLERYRYAGHDAADDTAGTEASLDPEVLGRAFEALMHPVRRGETGTFYTPPAVVDRLVGSALAHYVAGAAGLSVELGASLVAGRAEHATPAARRRAEAALRDVRVLDPACGSGAFLLGALARITRARSALRTRPASMSDSSSRAALRKHVVANALHGVDLLDDAALLCSLRLWLALTPAPGAAVPPLPNLDRRIRQGDALLDPLDLLTPVRARGADRGAALDPAVRQAIRTLTPLGHAYLSAEPEQRVQLHDRLRGHEVQLARLWLESLRDRLAAALRASRAAATDRDLWGEAALHAERAARDVDRLSARLIEVERLLADLRDTAALPFFSFLVHFASERSGFDVIVSNPPWVRAHRWPGALAGAVRERYHVCRAARATGRRGDGGTATGGQVDLALLFLERSLGLLADGGVLAMLLPAKLLRSLFAGGARELLQRQAAVLEIEDHSLDQRSIFRADAFTVALVARRHARSGAPARPATSVAPPVRVSMVRRGVDSLEFVMDTADLPLERSDARSPWLLAPPDLARVLRRMQQVGILLGHGSGARIRRGVLTGANDVLVVVTHEHRLGGLARVHAQGWARLRRRGSVRDAAAYTAWIESTALRPLLRGSDVRAWRWRTPQRIIWTPVNEQAGAPPGPRLARYLARHRDVLARRTGAAAGHPAGRLLRLAPETLGHKVVWQDIAQDLRAVAIPARVREAGADVPIVPLNTTYFLPADSADAALLLAAYLNSLPLRVYARAIAERAKDAHFRFFAWTVGALPLPPGWDRGAHAGRLLALSRQAHQQESLDDTQTRQLDRIVGAAYGLGEGDLEVLAGFDAWLRGRPA